MDRQNTQRGLNRKALLQPDPSHAQQSRDVQSALHTHTGPDDFRESRSSLLSCLAFSLASAFSSFLAFTIWDTGQSWERAPSAKPPKAQLQEKKDQSTSQAWKRGREEGQGNWDRFKHILRRLIRPGSYLRNEVLNQQLIQKFCLSKAEVLADPIIQSVSVVPETWISPVTSMAATRHPSASSGILCTHP